MKCPKCKKEMLEFVKSVSGQFGVFTVNESCVNEDCIRYGLLCASEEALNKVKEGE